MRGYPDKVKIIEVGPRDGLQNESQTIALKDKLQLIQQLADAGLTYIEGNPCNVSRAFRSIVPMVRVHKLLPVVSVQN